MKYFKLKTKELLEVFSDKDVRMDYEMSTGLLVLPKHQMMDLDVKVQYGMIDEVKFNNLIENEPLITLFESIEEVNQDIDLEYDEIFSLRSSQDLMLDLQLSGYVDGNGVITVEGYDKNQTLRSQDNLKLLYNLNIDGISKNKKAEHFI